MMKRICVFFLLFFYVFSIGFWQGTFEKRWVVKTSPNSEGLYVKGVFIAETPYQNATVVELSTATNVEKENESQYIVYERQYPGVENFIYAKANVVSYYLPRIKEDPPLDSEPIFTTNKKAMYNELIKAKADELKNETVLKTIVALTSFVHEYVEYNETAAGEMGAAEVFVERRGVCVEYSHLLMAMLNAVGIENRMVYGYAYSERWEPHVWVEAYVPNYGWVDVDPTYGQVGFLDGRRIAMNINDRKEGIYDFIQLRNGVGDFEYSLYTEPQQESGFDLANIHITYNWPYFIVNVENKNDFYVYGRYEISFPNNISNSEKKTIFLGPHETVVYKYRINEESFEDGYMYFVKVRVKFLDNEEERGFEVRKPTAVVEKHSKENGWLERMIEEINKFLFVVLKQLGLA